MGRLFNFLIVSVFILFIYTDYCVCIFCSLVKECSLTSSKTKVTAPLPDAATLLKRLHCEWKIDIVTAGSKLHNYVIYRSCHIAFRWDTTPHPALPTQPHPTQTNKENRREFLWEVRISLALKDAVCLLLKEKCTCQLQGHTHTPYVYSGKTNRHQKGFWLQVNSQELQCVNTVVNEGDYGDIDDDDDNAYHISYSNNC